MTRLHFDYETYCDVDLKAHGLDRYSDDLSNEVMICGYAFDDDEPQTWDYSQSLFPLFLREAIESPDVVKWAFNGQFERVMSRRVLGLKTDYASWRCTMVLSYMQSFTGTLEQVGMQVGLPPDKQKSATGRKLIKQFCVPQKVTKNQPLVRRTFETDPEDWQKFVEYCRQDVVAETAIYKRLIKYPSGPDEWELYALDQLINDRGFPIDRTFMRNGIEMAERRKQELLAQMRDLTGLANPNSTQQLVPWLQDRGYPFGDLRKDTVKKVLTEHEEGVHEIGSEAVPVLRRRQWAARTSTRKLTALANAVGDDGNMRFCFQFGGASRTQRFAGRRFQPHNLSRTPKALEPDKKFGEITGSRPDYLLTLATNYIRSNDYDSLSLLLDEPMEVLVGTMRSVIRAPDGEMLVVADLASIETRITAWSSRCVRLLKVFADGLDPYIDFATDLFSRSYAEVSKRERQDSKPAVLGCTYRLGGGDLRGGKRTGLWGYAESMGVNLTRDQSHRAVRVFRDSYFEIVDCWYALEKAVRTCVQSGRKVIPKIGSVELPVEMEMRKPYLIIWMPSGGPMYYHLPRIEWVTMYGADGEPYEKLTFSYMGKDQFTNVWKRIYSHGGKVFENLVQKIARDVLKVGMLRAHKEGFTLVGHVHDELISRQREGDNYYTYTYLGELMSEPISWLPGCPLVADGFVEPFYRK